MSNLLSSVSAALLPHFQRSQAFATRYVPLFANPYIFVAASAIVALLVFLALGGMIYNPRKRQYQKFSPSAQVEEDKEANIEDSKYDVVIVGAGVIGASMATLLGRRGVRVLCVERDLSEPDRIVGELMQPSGVQKLRELGLEESLEGIDIAPVPGYVVMLKDKSIHLPYPDRDSSVPESTNQDKLSNLVSQLYSKAEARFKGCGFHNGRFVMSLRRMAKQQSSVNLIQGTVQKLLQAPSGRVTGVMYKSEGVEHRVRARLTVVVDGCLSVFRPPMANYDLQVTSKFLGLILKDCNVPVPNHGHVILADPSPVLVYPISSNEQRMLIDFRKMPESDEALHKHMMENILPQLPEGIKPSFIRAVKEANGKYLSMPNQSMRVNPHLFPGVLLIGDSFNMRHPLTGGGMTVGYTDLQIAMKQFENVNWSSTSSVQNAVDSFYDKRHGTSATINILADALYQVMLQANPDLREGCFAYLGAGSMFSYGPTCLLSGISRSQLRLFWHFYCVAFFALGRLLLPFPTPGRIIRAFNLFRTACSILLPILARENKTFATKMLWLSAKTLLFL